jgi:hypothetical protein
MPDMDCTLVFVCAVRNCYVSGADEYTPIPKLIRAENYIVLVRLRAHPHISRPTERRKICVVGAGMMEPETFTIGVRQVI